MVPIRLALAPFVLMCAVLPATGRADEIATLRAELEALEAEHARQLSDLEARLAQLEAAAAASQAGGPTEAAPPTADTTGVETDVPAPAPAATGSNAFNPALAVILAGRYAQLSRDPATYRVAGFIPSGGEVGPGERGFDLGESELTLSASVDPWFFGSLTAAISADGETAVEEAFFRTLALHGGFTLKGGRFFSGVGYLNETHAHAWDFVDQPLVYQAFLGGQLAQDGVQLKWLAPTETFLELGAEAGSGDAFPGTRRDRNGLNGNALFAHLGGDLGEAVSWRAGASWLDHRAEDRRYEDFDVLGRPVVNAFTGRARTWVLDATLKWTPPGDIARRQLELQGEYLRRRERGQLAFDVEGLHLGDSFRSSQAGWYVQSVYRFHPRWRIGARWDSLDPGSPRIALVARGLLAAGDFPALLSASPERFTMMLDWSPSEFSRLRAQYAWDEARAAERDGQLLLQYLYSIGAHGAHKF